jgi:hypothetical protein
MTQSIISRIREAFCSQVYFAAVREAASPMRWRQSASVATRPSHSDNVRTSLGSSRTKSRRPWPRRESEQKRPRVNCRHTRLLRRSKTPRPSAKARRRLGRSCPDAESFPGTKPKRPAQRRGRATERSSIEPQPPEARQSFFPPIVTDQEDDKCLVRNTEGPP